MVRKEQNMKQVYTIRGGYSQYITKKGGWLDNLTAILGTPRKGVR